MLPESNQPSWRPSASLAAAKQRAHFLSLIREFFRERGVLEVTTQLLSHTAPTAPYIEPLAAFDLNNKDKIWYLHTSPEYMMKRLLADWRQCIYQIAPVFRAGEIGSMHNLEFTMLEWYRIGYSERDLALETIELLRLILQPNTVKEISYWDLLQLKLNIKPADSSCDIQNKLSHVGVELSRGFDLPQTEALLDIALDYVISSWPKDEMVIVYDFPKEQAALARLDKITNLAARFEIFYRGLELANGYHELTCPKEHLKRFKLENKTRAKSGRNTFPPDLELIQALEHGLPDCAGVAVGIDRVLMLANNYSTIQDVVNFPINL